MKVLIVFVALFAAILACVTVLILNGKADGAFYVGLVGLSGEFIIAMVYGMEGRR